MMIRRLVTCMIILVSMPMMVYGIRESRRMQSKWDIQPGIMAKLTGMKDPGHETLCMNAFRRIKKRSLRRYINKRALKYGVRYNDMPGNDGSDTSVLRFTRRFLMASKVERTAVARSHMGCQQYWHAQCPIATHEGTQLLFDNGDVKALIREQILDWYFDAFEKLFVHLRCKHDGRCAFDHERISAMWDSVRTSEGTLDKVRHTLLYGANVVRESFRWLKKRMGNMFRNGDYSDFKIASILHVVQDSYANGHCIRTRSGPKGCGKIALFTGYPMQSGRDFHGDTDHLVGSKADKGAGSLNHQRRTELFKCAERASYEFLLDWAYCKEKVTEMYMNPEDRATFANTETIMDVYEHMAAKGTKYKDVLHSCVFPAKWFDRHFALLDGVEHQQCGGANTFSSMFYDKDPAVMKQNLQKAKAQIEARTLEVKYAGDDGTGKPFADCDDVDKPKKGYCTMRVYQPKFKFKSDTHTTPGSGATVVGGQTNPPVEAIDFDLYTKKDDICREQMSHRDAVYWRHVHTKRRQWQEKVEHIQKLVGGQ